MKIATVREFRDLATTFLRSKEPVLVTRRGKAAGVFLPLTNPGDLPLELRKEIQTALAESVREALEEKGIAEEEVLADFEGFRKRRKLRSH